LHIDNRVSRVSKIRLSLAVSFDFQKVPCASCSTPPVFKPVIFWGFVLVFAMIAAIGASSAALAVATRPMPISPPFAGHDEHGVHCKQKERGRPKLTLRRATLDDVA
jgi:hypothetical protein